MSRQLSHSKSSASLPQIPSLSSLHTRLVLLKMTPSRPQSRQSYHTRALQLNGLWTWKWPSSSSSSSSSAQAEPNTAPQHYPSSVSSDSGCDDVDDIEFIASQRRIRRIQRQEKMLYIRNRLDSLRKPTWVAMPSQSTDVYNTRVTDIPREFACKLRQIELQETERLLSDELERLEIEDRNESHSDCPSCSNWHDNESAVGPDNDSDTYVGSSCTTPRSSILASQGPAALVDKVTIKNRAPLFAGVMSTIEPLGRETTASIFSAGSSPAKRTQEPLLPLLPSDTVLSPREPCKVFALQRALGLETCSLPPHTAPGSPNSTISRSLPTSMDRFTRNELLKGRQRYERPLPQHTMTMQQFDALQRDRWAPHAHRTPLSALSLSEPSSTRPAISSPPISDPCPSPSLVFSRKNGPPIMSSSMGGQRLQRSLLACIPVEPPTSWD